MPPDDTATLPVEPPVHVECYADHLSVAWTAGGAARFIGAVAKRVPSESPAVVETVGNAGRAEGQVADLNADGTRYVRVDPPGEWTVAWERRTTPVVTLTGNPDAATCRDLHLATTDCEGWSDAALKRASVLIRLESE